MKNPKYFLLTLSLFLIICAGNAFSQSTSTMIPIKGRALDGTLIDPATSPKIVRGSSYLTISLQNTQIFQKSGFFQNLIEINRQAVVGYEIKGLVDGETFSDSRISPNLALKNTKNAYIDSGWNINLIENLPTNFNGLEVRLNVSKSAKNGFSDAIEAASSISGSTPVLTLAPEVSAGLGAAKAVSDFLFNRNLLQKKIESRNPIDISGEGLPSGFYVVFAGRSSDDYAQYVGVNDRNKLIWTGADVLFDNVPVEGVSYFVIQIKSSPRYFPNSDVAPLSTNRAWANLYHQARGKIDKLTKPNDYNLIKEEIRTSLADARTIINKDFSLINAERNEIHTSVSRAINTELTEKLREVQAQGRSRRKQLDKTAD